MDTPRSAALLVRISDDRAGDAAGVGRQEEDARRLAERLGWTVGAVFIENDTSAFKRRAVRRADGSIEYRVFRPEFRRLLEAIHDGSVDGLIAYHLDRVARDPYDMEDLIAHVEQARIPVESVTGSLRLSSDADITMARIGVAIANQSSRDASRRIRRKHEELAEKGAYGGGGARRYGFERDGITVREGEAETLRWAAARVLDGWSVSRIARELDRMGVRPVKASQWSAKTLTDQLRSPRIAGLRVHRGQVVGDAVWPAIVDRETWEAVVAVLSSRSRDLQRPTLKRWLNGLLLCAHCGHTLSGGNVANSDRLKYWCKPERGKGCGKLVIAGAQTEAEITRQVLEYLGRPDVLEALSASAAGQDSARTRNDLAADERELRELVDLWKAKTITLTEYAEMRRVIQERIESHKVVRLARFPAGLRKVLSSEDRAASWDQLTPAMKRDVTKSLLELGGYVGWRVAPADLTKARRFDASRLELVTDNQYADQEV